MAISVRITDAPRQVEGAHSVELEAALENLTALRGALATWAGVVLLSGSAVQYLQKLGVSSAVLRWW